jgi:hypothetical protein
MRLMHDVIGAQIRTLRRKGELLDFVQSSQLHCQVDLIQGQWLACESWPCVEFRRYTRLENGQFDRELTVHKHPPIVRPFHDLGGRITVAAFSCVVRRRVSGAAGCEHDGNKNQSVVFQVCCHLRGSIPSAVPVRRSISIRN